MLRRNKPGQLQRPEDGKSGGRARESGGAVSTRTGLVTHTAAQRPVEASTREPFTYVHRGTVITGEVRGVGRVRVHGEIKGDVRIDGVLEVAESGSVEGALIEAREVKILGRVKADVVAGGKVEIWKGGVLIGDVRASALDIEEGATFNGFSHMQDDAGGRRDGSADGLDDRDLSVVDAGADASAAGVEDGATHRLAAADATGTLEAVEDA